TGGAGGFVRVSSARPHRKPTASPAEPSDMRPAPRLDSAERAEVTFSGEPGAARGDYQREKEPSMQIKRNGQDTSHGPSDWFTGAVYIDNITSPAGEWRIGAASVRFAPGARTTWHTHPHGQTIWVTEGVGLCQRRGGAVEVIRAGDRVSFDPGE